MTKSIMLAVVTIMLLIPMCVPTAYADPNLSFALYERGKYDRSYESLWSQYSSKNPNYGWLKDGRFLIEFFASDSASDMLDRNSGSLSVEGDKIIITFKYHPIVTPQNMPVLSWASLPMLLQFLISDLPEKDYTVEVRRLRGEPRYSGWSTDPTTSP